MKIRRKLGSDVRNVGSWLRDSLELGHFALNWRRREPRQGELDRRQKSRDQSQNRGCQGFAVLRGNRHADAAGSRDHGDNGKVDYFHGFTSCGGAVGAGGAGVGEPKMAIKAAKAAITFGPYVVSHWRSAVQLMAVAPTP